MENKKLIGKAISTLSNHGYHVRMSTPDMIRMGKAGNWIEISLDKSSYVAYRECNNGRMGEERFANFSPRDLNLAVQLCIDIF